MIWVLVLFLIILFLYGQRKEHMRSRPLLGPSPARLYDPKSYPYTPASELGPDKPPPDDGTERSDITTKQQSIYFYQPFASLPFPTSLPPQPYLNDFSPFQR